MKNIFIYAWKEVVRRKHGSISNSLGFMLATSFLALALTFSGFSVRGTSSALNYTGAQFIGFVYSAEQGMPDISFKDPANEGFLVYNYPVVPFPAELVNTINLSPNIRHASALLTFAIVTGRETRRSWMLAGFDPSDMESVRMVNCSGTEIVQGRSLVPGDRGVALLEQTFADAEQYTTGDTIFFEELRYKVAGILSPGTRPARADIYMSFEDAMEVLNSRIEQPVRDVANVVLVDGASAILTYRAQNDVRELLGFNSSTLGYSCMNPAGAALGITFRGMRLTGILVFSGIILLIAVSGYHAVAGRRNDIGILKAIGWSDRSVMMQIISESLIVSAAGAFAGTVFAIIFFSMFPSGNWLGIDPSMVLKMNTGLIITGYVITVVAGILTGAGSALLSLRHKPAQILRGL